MSTSRDSSTRPTRERRNNASAMLKIARLAAMPSASEAIDVIANSGLCRQRANGTDGVQPGHVRIRLEPRTVCFTPAPMKQSPPMSRWRVPDNQEVTASRARQPFVRLAVWTTALTYSLILVGSLVRASGAGLGVSGLAARIRLVDSAGVGRGLAAAVQSVAVQSRADVDRV